MVVDMQRATGTKESIRADRWSVSFRFVGYTYGVWRASLDGIMAVLKERYGDGYASVETETEADAVRLVWYYTPRDPVAVLAMIVAELKASQGGD